VGRSAGGRKGGDGGGMAGAWMSLEGDTSDPDRANASDASDVLPLSATRLPRRERGDADAISERQRRRTGEEIYLGRGVKVEKIGAHASDASDVLPLSATRLPR
jgi:hypothetical protein